MFYVFIATAVSELNVVRSPRLLLTKQLTCGRGYRVNHRHSGRSSSNGRYKNNFSDASIGMSHNGVTCSMISPYKVKWHSRLKHGKRTMKKVDHAVDFLLINQAVADLGEGPRGPRPLLILGEKRRND